ncbi:glycine receptor subunit alpha-4-like [Branchiostoma lanceolatum]|uniref:glycine receptor subunit alpha-4-like n=1 Tax=Branchiostoma lanceolatum TaxID=7740 RepID=UPI0034536C32
MNCLSEISTLDVRLQFSRGLQRHVLQTFLATASVVCTSWLGTWLHPREVNARVGLGISTLLSQIIKSSNDENPKTNLVRAYDIWMIGCLVVVMLTLLETVLVNYICSGGKLALWSTRVEPTPRQSTAWAGEEEDKQHPAEKEANKVDLFARIVFPIEITPE